MARFPHSRVECEFAFRLLNDVPARPQGYTPEELASRVTLRLATEILCSRGIALTAGEYVSTGAATDPRHVHAGAKVRARFGELGEISIEFV